MTGEITLTGQVLPIGGLKEKALAAQRNGVRTIIAPALNEADAEDIPEHLRKRARVRLGRARSARCWSALDAGEAPRDEPASPGMLGPDPRSDREGSWMAKKKQKAAASRRRRDARKSNPYVQRVSRTTSCATTCASPSRPRGSVRAPVQRQGARQGARSTTRSSTRTCRRPPRR